MTDVQFDLTTWVGISAVVTAIVGIVKRFLPNLKGFEPVVALVLGVALASLAKAAGWGWTELNWVELVLAGLTSGVGSGLIHDKVTNPVLGKG